MNKTTTPADAAEWADSLVVRHRKPLADKILGTGPRCRATPGSAWSTTSSAAWPPTPCRTCAPRRAIC